MKIVFGCDHAGYEIKDAVIAHIKEKGHEVIDVGTYSSASCHYPVYASAACEKILSGEIKKGESVVARWNESGIEFSK